MQNLAEELFCHVEMLSEDLHSDKVSLDALVEIHALSTMLLVRANVQQALQ